jgi:hypothetical protein
MPASIKARNVASSELLGPKVATILANLFIKAPYFRAFVKP